MQFLVVRSSPVLDCYNNLLFFTLSWKSTAKVQRDKKFLIENNKSKKNRDIDTKWMFLVW